MRRACTGRARCSALLLPVALCSELSTERTPCEPRGGPRPPHPYELKPRAVTQLGVSHRQTGVGDNDSWGTPPLEKYLLHANRTYRYGYRLARPRRGGGRRG
ncbi:hypothetical protein DY245_31325 [Streptomyces inhibens]|uniref:Beta galactosidase small chain/ domain-containing protein n=1 Tax=Streptomyces inhibens TaxID=2293571 RepID=A0A371PVY6_STRIH|nr:hypothetical protein [Streptomyces inhibens]REK86649.1 hypothetical protein DY245_31325 [Streptomyces inhibens]